MAEPKGERLFVNLGASQARRRLKGFGHGVRKVQTAGRNQAVIIHTATGQHLDELQAKFADVGFTRNETNRSESIQSLRNLGPTSSAWLHEVGVHTTADLERLGAARAYRLVKQKHPAASLNLLWALAAGLAGKDWRQLAEAEKERLLAESRSSLSR